MYIPTEEYKDWKWELFLLSLGFFVLLYYWVIIACDSSSSFPYIIWEHNASIYVIHVIYYVVCEI